jgi:hypothetical protein
MTRLTLACNSLSGAIPAALNTLTKLTNLSIQGSNCIDNINNNVCYPDAAGAPPPACNCDSVFSCSSPRCATHTCGAGYETDASKNALYAASDARCCTQNPTCSSRLRLQRPADAVA